MYENLSQQDVSIIGCGLAGMAVAIHLAKAGFRVLCIEAGPEDKILVGESLDWSAPDLLGALGLPMDALINRGIATYKRHIVVHTSCGRNQEYIPSAWLGRPPWNIELRTLHVDRIRLRAAIREIMFAAGVNVLHDRVTGFECSGKTLHALQTQGGKRIVSPWFIDASGFAASLLPRFFGLPHEDYGPSKVAFWSYFPVPDSIEGTTLYVEGNRPNYMEWVWEIPIQRNTVSVGYICPGEAIKSMRQRGESVEQIYREKLGTIPRFEPLLRAAGPVTPQTTSYRCRAYRGVAGPNWFVVGEAAAMIDPMTSNGVTAALRHAAEASALIIRNRRRGRIPWTARTAYSRRIQALARFFNYGIERVIYDAPIRDRIGILNAGDAYTIPAWSMNVVYSRTRPTGLIGTGLFSLVLACFNAASCVFYWLCRRLPQSPKLAGAPS